MPLGAWLFIAGVFVVQAVALVMVVLGARAFVVRLLASRTVWP